MYSPKLLLAAATVIARTVAQDQCPGYVASNVQETGNRLTASLQLAGEACNLYGTDLPNLTLTVEYQTDTRIHVLIEDLEQNVYQVPEEIVPRPQSGSASSDTSELKFSYVQSPFSFAVSRSNGEVLFNTSGWPLIFESQYLGLRTSLPESPSLYGLGEHMDPFQLNTTNYTRTLWSRDAYGIPPGTNLYGNHPVYLDNRAENGTHGVLLLNSNGMDIKINDTDGQYLEYNVIGGVIDLYFVAGPSPVEASQQLSEVVGKPAMIPYWSLGYHNCRYGYRDVYQVAEVVYNYSMAGVPLEVMWTDIDYMLLRRVFTLDPERFPLSKMRELVGHLHEAGQHYIVMVDPAVAYQDYDAYNNGLDLDVWLKYDNGTLYQGAVWPGPTVFPDWFHPNITEYWNSEFASFFSAESGVDIDGLWIDMNEAANFCPYPCLDPQGFANESGNPPDPPPVRDGPAIPLPGFPADFQPGASNLTRRQSQTKLGLPDRELIDPPYMIQNAAGSLSNKTINTDLHHHNGLTEYDTHNFYGSMMSVASRTAMLARRPDVRPLVITRSTFLVSQPMSPPAQNRSDPVRYENINRSPFPLFDAFFSAYINNHLINVPNGMQLTAVQGAGTAVGHWTGDNAATWEQYHLSISDMLNFNSIFHIPMVGSDICGFSGNTTETLCARWAMLGAFYPFMRNHNADNSIPQEFYRWPSVAAAARYAIDIRYRLLDYFYTAFYLQTTTGTPSLNPLWFLYPNDTNTFANYGQFFFGDAVLVSPVLEENSTSVDIYVPQDVFYDVNDGFKPIKGSGAVVTLDDVGFQTIPLHVRGGTVVPLRVRDGANTTAELRTRNFELVVAPGMDGSAQGSLYLDDGASLQQQGTTFVNFTYSAGDGTFSMMGEYGYDAAGVEVERLLVLGVGAQPANVTLQGGSQGALPYTYDAETQVVSVSVTIPLTMDATVSIVAG